MKMDYDIENCRCDPPEAAKQSRLRGSITDCHEPSGSRNVRQIEVVLSLRADFTENCFPLIPVPPSHISPGQTIDQCSEHETRYGNIYPVLPEKKYKDRKSNPCNRRGDKQKDPELNNSPAPQ